MDRIKVKLAPTCSLTARSSFLVFVQTNIKRELWKEPTIFWLSIQTSFKYFLHNPVVRSYKITRWTNEVRIYWVSQKVLCGMKHAQEVSSDCSFGLGCQYFPRNFLVEWLRRIWNRKKSFFGRKSTLSNMMLRTFLNKYTFLSGKVFLSGDCELFTGCLWFLFTLFGIAVSFQRESKQLSPEGLLAPLDLTLWKKQTQTALWLFIGSNKYPNYVLTEVGPVQIRTVVF